jgi:hypothetical protein
VIEKNDPELERVWYEALALGLVGTETDFVVRRDERGIIRLVRRTMTPLHVEYLDEGGK